MERVVALSAVGGPYSLSGQSGAWDLKPVLAFACSLLLVRAFVGIRISWAIAGGCLLVGMVLATLIDVWGVLPATSLGLTVAVILRIVMRHRRPRLTGRAD
jgi:hypothetical protein